MDAFDEFELKPLTKGLGFHGKSQPVAVPNEDGDEGTASEDTINNLLSKLKSPGFDEPVQFKETKFEDKKEMNAPAAKTFAKPAVKLSTTLPRPGEGKKAFEFERPVEKSTPGKNGLKNPSDKNFDIPPPPAHLRRENWGIKDRSEPAVRRGGHDSFNTSLKPATFSLGAALIDALTILGISLLFLIPLLVVTKVNLARVFLSAQSDLTTQISVLVLYLSVMEIYVVLARSFFGCTLGENAFGYQLGTDEEHAKGTYPLLIMWRSMIIALTGFILFPLLSLIFRRDLAYYLTGVRIYRRE